MKEDRQINKELNKYLDKKSKKTSGVEILLNLFPSKKKPKEEDIPIEKVREVLEGKQSRQSNKIPDDELISNQKEITQPIGESNEARGDANENMTYENIFGTEEKEKVQESQAAKEHQEDQSTKSQEKQENKKENEQENKQEKNIESEFLNSQKNASSGDFNIDLGEKIEPKEESDTALLLNAARIIMERMPRHERNELLNSQEFIKLKQLSEDRK